MRLNRIGVAALLVTWVTVVSGGFALLLRYKSAPGEAHRPPLHWPQESRLERASSPRATVVQGIHSSNQTTAANGGRLRQSLRLRLFRSKSGS